MAGPFPGMDPYIESRAAWPDFHNRLVAEICNDLGVRLSDTYIARVDERIEVATWAQEPPRSFRPDALVGRLEKHDVYPTVAPADRPVGLLEPTLVEILDRDPEEIRSTWVEIRALPNLELVTAIEVLSPINKSGQGRRAYLEKRDTLHGLRVNLVEIDLLLAGAPLPMKEPLDPGAYYAIVARGARLPIAEVYRWSVRDPLPQIPIPLREPDPDIQINLDSLVSRVYDLGRYARTLRHDTRLPDTTTLPPDDRGWAENRALIPDR